MAKTYTIKSYTELETNAAGESWNMYVAEVWVDDPSSTVAPHKVVEIRSRNSQQEANAAAQAWIDAQPVEPTPPPPTPPPQPPQSVLSVTPETTPAQTTQPTQTIPASTNTPSSTPTPPSSIATPQPSIAEVQPPPATAHATETKEITQKAQTQAKKPLLDFTPPWEAWLNRIRGEKTGLTSASTAEPTKLVTPKPSIGQASALIKVYAAGSPQDVTKGISAFTQNVGLR